MKNIPFYGKPCLNAEDDSVANKKVANRQRMLSVSHLRRFGYYLVTGFSQ